MAKLQAISIILVITGLVFFTGCGEQKHESLASAQLWEQGDWVLYDLNRVNNDGTETHGSLKVSSVGQEMIEGHIYHWLELREDSQDGVTITKFLAKEKNPFNPENGFTFWEDIKRIIIQKDTNPPEEVPTQHIRRYTPHFVESGSAKRYGNVENIDPPVREILPEKSFTVSEMQITAPGSRRVQHFTSSVNLGFLNLEDTTQSSVEYYRSPNVPFGGIMEVRYRSSTNSVNKLKPDAPPKPPQHYENSMHVKAFGNGAETQIIGTPVEMEVMPFPFLEAARKGAGNS